MSKFRNFTFTLNNYDSKPELVEALDTLACKYMVYGKEVGAEGTPHLQGHVTFSHQKTETAARKVLRGCHVEVSKAPVASVQYCKKDGDYKERGTPPQDRKEAAAAGGAAEQERWRKIRIAAEEGRFDEIPENVRFSQYKAVQHHREQGLKKRKLEDTEEQHLWYYGPTGTGKSRKARTEYPDAYLKLCNKWWDGYEDQKEVLIEDFDKVHGVLCHHMKIWGDRYPFTAEVKGGSTGAIRPTRIIVTSNYHPEDIWESDNDLNPILRRFKCVKFGEYPEKKGKKSCPESLRAFANSSFQ